MWAYAKANDFVIVSKDSDFVDLSVLEGAPPKVVWVRLGNCTTASVALLLRECEGDATVCRGSGDLLDARREVTRTGYVRWGRWNGGFDPGGRKVREAGGRSKLSGSFDSAALRSG